MLPLQINKTSQTAVEKYVFHFEGLSLHFTSLLLLFILLFISRMLLNVCVLLS